MLLGAYQHDDIDRLAERVIACAIEVHKHMGPGLNEGVYKESFMLELANRGIPFEADVPIRVDDKGHRLTKHFEVDLIVDDHRAEGGRCCCMRASTRPRGKKR